jgi:isopenicillin N synthase-like dioxygenase
VPIIDVKPFLTEAPFNKSDCKQVADALHKYGCVVIKDPRVNQDENDRFLDVFEKYFSKRSKEYYEQKTANDIYPEYDYQVGATPEYKEKARDHGANFQKYSK